MNKMSFNPRRRKALLALGVAGAVPAAIVAWPFAARLVSAPAPMQRVVIATPLQSGTGNIHVALADRLFENNGLDVVRQPMASGLKALAALLEKRADLAIVADTPIVTSTMKGSRLAIVATIFESRKGLAIVARSDRNIERPSDLQGKRIGVTFGTNAQFFLETMLVMHGVPLTGATIVDTPPEDLVPAIKSGRIDAVTVFNPHLVNLVADRTFPHRLFYGDELYKFRFNVVASRDYLQANRQIVDGVVAGLVEASYVIRAEPDRARKLISQASNTEDAATATIFNPNDYDVHLDQSLLLALEDQSRWAIRRKLVPTTVVPDYLEQIDIGPLTRVAPATVTIVR